MPVSQNGYSANDRSVIETYTVGKGIRVPLRKGSPGFLLMHFANWFDANIQDIDAGRLDDWGYAERPIRGAIELSNHASGTAIDLNATRWPLGMDPSINLNETQIKRIREHLKIYQGAIRWGGDYIERKDPMHFEINRDEAFCDTIARQLMEIDRPMEDDMFLLIQNSETGTIGLFGPGFAEQVNSSHDLAALKGAGIKHVQLTNDLFDRMVKNIRLVGVNVDAIRADLADEEPTRLPPRTV